MSVTHIDLPEEFNVAAWFVDRNLDQGRGERVANGGYICVGTKTRARFKIGVVKSF